MTCIVGLKSKGKVYIGADSLGSDSAFNKTVRADEKIFTKGEMIFGFTSSYRMGQLLRYGVGIPSRPEGIDDMNYLVAHFIPALINGYENGGWGGGRDGKKEGGTFLLGYRGELYKVEGDFQVGRPMGDYDACGCGEAYAKGSLFSSKLLAKHSPEDRIQLALEAAAEHSAGVAGPFKIIEL